METFNPTDLSRPDALNAVPFVAAGTTLPGSSKATKNGNGSVVLPRIDFEPLYTDLKALVGHNWAIYHEALIRFLRGEWSAVEFGDATDNFLLANPATEHAHNSLICAIAQNTTRDSPEPGPAAWVSAASDKAVSTSATKPSVASDAAEQRLKVEVMKLLPRDRRRIKAICTDRADEEAAAARRNIYDEYYQAGKIRVPDSVPASAGGLNKTNWDLEIRKRYTQPLFSETLEFPDAATIFARMVPICYEESVASGSTIHCADLVSIATESYVKDYLGSIFTKTRSNPPLHQNGAGPAVFTGAYQQQLDKEEEECKRGKISRNRDNGLLPVESKEANARRPLAMCDLQMASHVTRGLWNGLPLIGARVMDAVLDDELEEWRRDRAAEQVAVAALDRTTDHADGVMDLDDHRDDDHGWAGAGRADREALASLLQDCLSTRA